MHYHPFRSRFVQLGPHEVRVRARDGRPVEGRAELDGDDEDRDRDVEQERERVLPHGGGCQNR